MCYTSGSRWYWREIFYYQSWCRWRGCYGTLQICFGSSYFCFKVKVLAPYWKMELLELFNVLFWVMQIFRSNFRPLNNVLERNDFNNFMLNSVTTLRKNEVWARWPDPQCCIKCFFFKIQWTVRISSLQDWKSNIF